LPPLGCSNPPSARRRRVVRDPVKWEWMANKNRLVFSLLAALVTLVSPRVSLAQNENDSPLRNSITLLGGGLIYDPGGDGMYPFVSAGVGRALSRFVEVEGVATYARLTTKLYSFAPTFTSYDARTPFLAADAAANFLLPLGPFVPYVGVSAGVFRRNATYDTSNTVQVSAVKGTSLGAAVGARWLFTPRVGLRGEFHYRQDSHEGWSSRANDIEQSLGLMYRF
jgi:hypothetical protein